MVLEGPVISLQPQIEKESVESVLTKMNKSKASGRSGVVTEMLLALGDASLEKTTSLINCILKEKRIHSEWDTKVIVNWFKHKGEARERQL